MQRTVDELREISDEKAIREMWEATQVWEDETTEIPTEEYENLDLDEIF